MGTDQAAQQTKGRIVTMMPTEGAAIRTKLPDITALHESIRAQKISPVEVVSECLEQVEDLNPKLNAFITVLGDQALQEARAAEAEINAGRYRGPLHGIPVGIKDFYDTAGIKTTAAFEHFKDRIPGKDAAGVTKLRAAGAIILGKTNMHRLGMGSTGLESYFGAVRNPWNADYIPGGSSSGSAAAVASGLCYASLDTDAIGSCRLPAACCGVVGFKGTYGLIDPTGILEGEQDPGKMIRWFAHPGIMTRSVRDVAIVLDVLAERNAQTEERYFDGLQEGREVRIGVADNSRADRAVSQAFENAVEMARSLGYSMSRVAAPLERVGDISNIEADRRAVAGHTFKDVDVLLLPTTTTTVPAVKDAAANPQALSPENTVFANYYGLPAISIPCGFDSNGLPLGLQIVGKPRGEATLLHLAHRYETAARHGGHWQAARG
jgi:aspartyl-tRNA(Asn)/glutamyl-tRNA(Gln) amidotransferase subunit A